MKGDYTMTASKLPFKGIIQRMRTTYNIYRLTRYVDNDIKRLDKKFPNTLRDKGKRIVSKKGQTLKYYNRTRHWQSYEKTSEYFDTAVAENYLKVDKGLVTVGESKGRRLLDGWPFFPYGLFREIWNNDGSFLKALGFAIVTFIGGAFFHKIILETCKT